MKGKTIKYFLYQDKRAVGIFYIVIYALFVSTTLLSRLSSNIHASMNGMEMASAIFLFVVGLNSFKENFHMLMANSVSRRTFFLSFAAGVAPLAGLMAAIDQLNTFLAGLVIPYQAVFDQLYGNRFPLFHGSPVNFLIAFVWSFLLYASATMIGFFITTAYYRMSTGLKLLISVGVPVLVFLVIPTLDFNLLGGVISSFLFKSVSMLLGLYQGAVNPLIAMISSIGIFVVFSGLSWLLVRTAMIKSNS